MNVEKIIISALVVAALSGLAWSITDFINGSKQSARLQNTPANFAQAVESELADKCATPADYTDEEWQEHMSHHPDRYQECF